MEIIDWHQKNNLRPLEVGDYVRVKEDLDMHKAYGTILTSEMLYFRGLVTRVSWIHGNGLYDLCGADEDCVKHHWSREMLEPAQKEDIFHNAKLVRWDRVRINPDIQDNDLDIVPDMPVYAGYTAYVTIINFDNGMVGLDVDGEQHWWPQRCLRRITEEEWRKENSSVPLAMMPGQFVRIKEEPSLQAGYYIPPTAITLISKYAGEKACVDAFDSITGTFSLVGIRSGIGYNNWWKSEMVDFID